MPRPRRSRSASVHAFPTRPQGSGKPFVLVSTLPRGYVDWRLSLLGDALIIVGGAQGRRVWGHAASTLLAKASWRFCWRGYQFRVTPNELTIQVLDPDDHEAWAALMIFIETMRLDPRHHTAIVVFAEYLLRVIPL